MRVPILVRAFCLVALLGLLGGCVSMRHSAGHLLMVGGGLDDDLRPVFERFVKLAARPGAPRVVIVTTAIAKEKDQRDEVTDKTEALRAWAPAVPVESIGRETTVADSVAAIDRATALFFTGGNQARLTQRYRPNGKDTPEWLAMRRLLARGGVIAGCSAGDAMMGELMLLNGGNASALVRDATDPEMGTGMGLLPWAITDSHFFERDRVGRLVVALEKSGRRLGLGVGEDGAVEVDLARGELIGVNVSDSLLVDVLSLRREGQTRCDVRARLIRQGDRVSLRQRLSTTPPPPAPKPAGPVQRVCLVDPGQNRQLALWRVFMGASRAGSGRWEIDFEGWRLVAWPDGQGEVIFEVSPTLE